MKVLELHVTGTERLVAILKRSRELRVANATRNYLLCKATTRRRQSEVADRQRKGEDTEGLEQTIACLEATMLAHKRLIESLSDQA